MSYGNNNEVPGEVHYCSCGQPSILGGVCAACWQEEEFIPPMHPNNFRCKVTFNPAPVITKGTETEYFLPF